MTRKEGDVPRGSLPLVLSDIEKGKKLNRKLSRAESDTSSQEKDGHSIRIVPFSGKEQVLAGCSSESIQTKAAVYPENPPNNGAEPNAAKTKEYSQPIAFKITKNQKESVDSFSDYHVEACGNRVDKNKSLSFKENSKHESSWHSKEGSTPPQTSRRRQKITWDAFNGSKLAIKLLNAENLVKNRVIHHPKTKKMKVSASFLLQERVDEDNRKADELKNLIAGIEEIHLETPLAKAVRILEGIQEVYGHNESARACIAMVLDILADSDSLHSVAKAINNISKDEDTVNWVNAHLSSGNTVVKSSNSNWKKLQNMSKKIGLKQLLEMNRRFKCQVIKCTFGHGRPEDYQVQVMAPKVLRDKAEGTLKEARRLGTQELVKAQDEENDYMSIPCFLHPELSTERHDNIQALLDRNSFLDWDFDIFQLEELSNGHTLWFASMFIFCYHDYISNFQINPAKLAAFLAEAERTYCFKPDDKNIYHNALHGADVALTVAHFCENEHVSDTLTGLQGFSLLTAAVMHDYRHPGLNNGFLMRTSHEVALTYNDNSVLENFHSSQAFQLLSKDQYNILEMMNTENKRNFRHYFIKVILATDLAHAFNFVDKFNSALNKEDGITKNNPESQLLLMQFTIKCADICHPAKPWNLHQKWSDLITKEFFSQGDKELENDIPLSPLCDKNKVDIPKSQCNFIDFLVRPCFTPFSTFCENDSWMKTIKNNYDQWKTLGAPNEVVPQRRASRSGTRRKSSCKVPEPSLLHRKSVLGSISALPRLMPRVEENQK